MAGNAVTNTFMTYQSVGNREDLGDIIFNISPDDTPFISRLPKASATGTYHEWNQDSLQAVDTANAAVQGDDIVAFDAVVPTVRRGNRTQILRKTLIVSGTEETILKAGRKSEIAYQTMKRGREIKRDLEAISLLSQAAVPTSAGVAPKMAGVPAWLITNTSNGAGAGANPTGDGTTVRVAGTPRALTEALLKTVLQSTYTVSSDEPDIILVPPAQKPVISAMSGNATRFIDATDKAIVSNVLMYSSDWGEHKIVVDRFMPATYILCMNADLWGLATLRALKMIDLAKTGDADKKMLLMEVTLESRNEAGNAAVYDLT